MRARRSEGSGVEARRRSTTLRLGVLSAFPVRGPGGWHDDGIAAADPVPFGTLHESTLHRDLKALVAAPGDRFEVPVRGFVVDIVRGDTCIEIQTGRFAAMGRKLDVLLADHHVHVVHPVATDTWIERRDKPRRRSPVHGGIHDVFAELASVPTMLDHPNLTVEVVLVEVEVVKVPDARLRRGRGGWRTVDRRLIGVVGRHGLRTTADLAALLPAGLPREWTTADLAATAGIGRRTAQQMAYVLRANDLVEDLGRRRDGTHYCSPA